MIVSLALTAPPWGYHYQGKEVEARVSMCVASIHIIYDAGNPHVDPETTEKLRTFYSGSWCPYLEPLI